MPDDGEAMESAVVAGAKDGGGAAVPARAPSPQAGLSRGSRCKSRCIFAINLLFPYAAAFLVRLINLGSGLHRGTRLSPAASGRIPNDSLKGAWKRPISTGIELYPESG